jgi:hypothetical protein
VEAPAILDAHITDLALVRIGASESFHPPPGGGFARQKACFRSQATVTRALYMLNQLKTEFLGMAAHDMRRVAHVMMVRPLW